MQFDIVYRSITYLVS